MTVKELAEELKTSKTTIKNIIKRLDIKTEKKLDRGQEIIDLTEEQANAIREKYYTKHPANFSANPENVTANITENTEKVSENTENPTEKLIAILKDQLDRKDQQIADLQDKLDKAYIEIADIAKKAQYITAADKTAQIIDKQQQKEDHEAPAADPGQTQTEKKGFLSRIFGRK